MGTWCEHYSYARAGLSGGRRGVSRTSDPDDDGSLQGFRNPRKHSQVEIAVSWEEIAVKKSLEVREALEVDDVVGKVETHYPRPVPHQETERARSAVTWRTMLSAAFALRRSMSPIGCSYLVSPFVRRVAKFGEEGQMDDENMCSPCTGRCTQVQGVTTSF